MGRGRPRYHIHRTCEETGEVFEDWAHVFYIDEENRSDTPLGKLLQDFSCPDPEKMNYKELAKRADFFKTQEKGVSFMCEIMDEFREKFENKGRMEGRMEERRELILRMASKGKSVEEIAELADLSVKEVELLLQGKPA